MTIAPEQQEAAARPRVDQPDRRTTTGPGSFGRALDPVVAGRRTWVAHAVLLAAVLLGILWWAAPDQVISADEGVLLSQADLIARTGGWSMPATSELDPNGDWFPMDVSARVGDRVFPFSHAPAYVLVVTELFELGGLPMVLALHVAALWLAALLAGRLAERLRPGRGLHAMWLVGVASPLLFDGYWAIAHTIVAAAATAAVLAAVKVVIDRRWSWSPVWLAGLVVATSFRSEPVLFAGGLALACGLAALRPSPYRLRAAAFAVSTALVGGASFRATAIWRADIEGTGVLIRGVPGDSSGFVEARLRGFGLSVLGAGEGGRPGALLVLVAAALLAAALAATRFGWGSDAFRRGCAIAGCAAAVVRLLLPVDLVTGLAMAAPLVVAGAACLPRDRWRDPATRLVAIAAAVTVAGVVMTQHERGGTGEWGGRYFHVVLPLLCVLATITADWLLEHRGTAARTVVAAGVVAALASSGLSLRQSDLARESADRLTETTWQVARTTRSATDPAGPVIVGTWRAYGRFAWRHLRDARYLRLEGLDDLPLLGRRLSAAGVADVTFLAQPGERSELHRIGSGYEVVRTEPIGTKGWAVVVLSGPGDAA